MGVFVGVHFAFNFMIELFFLIFVVVYFITCQLLDEAE
jgi:hypothetical protein